MKSAWLKSLTVLMLASICAFAAGTRQWTVLGPDGGDVRSLAYDPQNPNRIFLGTSTGVIFVSDDSGHNWSRFAKLGSGDDYVLDHIAFDPQNSRSIFVSAWSVQDQNAGDVFRTHNGGKDWEVLPAMHGKSVRAMAVSASDSKVVVAGALDGVYRSTDGGNAWQRISPNDGIVKNIESIAVDPKDPNVVYAGTWHLAWKTSDGGANWQHINKGMVDDSDVFSIIVSSANPSEVFASACSGIYKSVSGGDQFEKIKGIPFTARRTRVLKQDPSNPAIVYAGTTEGLWKSVDEGKNWKRVSNPEVVVNDVLIDPRNSQHVLLATDRSGVLASDDSAATFTPSNHGYSHRYVSAILADSKEPNTLYIGLVNDREFGGVFFSHDGGQNWLQKSSGLDGRDVFTLKQASSGTLVAGTNRGVFELVPGSSTWHPINDVVIAKTVSRTVRLKSGKKKTVSSTTSTHSVLEDRVNDTDLGSTRWFAATSSGLFTSKDHGKVWVGGPVAGEKDFVSVQAQGDLVVSATRSAVLVSQDSGAAWQSARLASYPINVRSVTVVPDGQIFVATREGAFHSPDFGKSWNHVMAGLPDKDITSVAYDGSRRRLLATSGQTGVVFESTDGGSTWQRGPDSGYPLRRISVVHGRYVAATPFDGVIAQPENESQSANAGGGSN
ncbi:MAG: transcriptional regulator [Candidatus Sulfotelmatobacter sp.]